MKSSAFRGMSNAHACREPCESFSVADCMQEPCSDFTCFSIACTTAGNGVIVHASDQLGLVLVDRSTVPVSAGNITLSFGAYPDELPARVRFLHPLHNFAIISYDPTQLSQQVSLSVNVW